MADQPVDQPDIAVVIPRAGVSRDEFHPNPQVEPLNPTWQMRVTVDGLFEYLTREDLHTLFGDRDL